MLHHRAAEVVNGRESGVLPAEWRQGRVPLPLLAPETDIIDGCHHSEARINAREVFGLNLGIAFHVGLAKAEEDVKVGIGGGSRLACQHRHTQQGTRYEPSAESIVLYHDLAMVKLRLQR